mgnify:CR=1 FL=1
MTEIDYHNFDFRGQQRELALPERRLVRETVVVSAMEDAMDGLRVRAVRPVAA